MNKSSNQFIIQVIGAIWVVGAINALLSYQFNYQLSQFGILPRHLPSLVGIFTTPFLHGSFYHLFNNTLAFIVLGWLVSLYNDENHNLLLRLTVFVTFWGGLLTWLMARPHLHIGLSGVIFGYWGFITVNGFFEKSLKAVLLSLLAIFFYGGMVFGVLPTQFFVSFESHFFGALSGIMYSYLYRKRQRQ